jgi:hypothetical protein
MTDRPHVRICLEGPPGGRRRLVLYHPDSCRTVPTGISAGPSQESIEYEVARIKNQLEKAGNRVSVAEVAP